METTLSRTGESLAADVGELWEAGHVHLPKLAMEYLSANGNVANTSDGLEAACRRPVPAHGPMQSDLGLVFPSWSRLRNQLQRVLGETGTNFASLGQALRLAAQEYARQDAAAQKGVDTARQRLGSEKFVGALPEPRYAK